MHGPTMATSGGGGGGHRHGRLRASPPPLAWPPPVGPRPKELTHVTACAAAHFPMPPAPLCVMVARPARVTQVTQVPITLTQHDTAAAPCDTTHPMWRHRGTARPEPPTPPGGWVSSKGDDATHSRRSRDINGSSRILAPLKHTSVIPMSRMVYREKGTTNKSYTIEKWVRSGVGGGPKERGWGLKTQPLGNGTSLQTHCPTLYHIEQPRDPSIRMQMALQRFKIKKILVSKIKNENLTYWIYRGSLGPYRMGVPNASDRGKK